MGGGGHVAAWAAAAAAAAAGIVVQAACTCSCAMVRSAWPRRRPNSSCSSATSRSAVVARCIASVAFSQFQRGNREALVHQQAAGTELTGGGGGRRRALQLLPQVGRLALQGAVDGGEGGQLALVRLHPAAAVAAVATVSGGGSGGAAMGGSGCTSQYHPRQCSLRGGTAASGTRGGVALTSWPAPSSGALLLSMQSS